MKHAGRDARRARRRLRGARSSRPTARPTGCTRFAKGAKAAGFKVIIAGAGGAAHLPGMTASLTDLPVLGVPVKTQALEGMDSLLSIVQMPAGIPVGTLAIGKAGAINAGLLAAQHPGARRTRGLAERARRLARRQTEAVGKTARASESPMSCSRPASTIGILGGGQLGRMLALAAARLGFSATSLPRRATARAVRVARARSSAPSTIARRSRSSRAAVDVVTYEFENVPAEAAAFLALAQAGAARPEGAGDAQDRLVEKRLLRQAEDRRPRLRGGRSAAERLGGRQGSGCPRC